MTNTSNGASALTSYKIVNDAGTYAKFELGGSGATNYTLLESSAGSGMFFGTVNAVQMTLYTNNTNRLVFSGTGGIYTANATGTDKGVETLNLHGLYYKDGVQIGNMGCQGTSASIAAATTDFIQCGEEPSVTVIPTEANSQSIVPCTGVLSNLYVKIVTAAAAAHPPVITVDDATTGTTLTCTINNSAPSTTTTCNDTTHNPAVTAGDLLSVKFANPATANASGLIYVGYKINCGS